MTTLDIKRDFDLQPFNTLRLATTAEHFVQAASEEEAKEAMAFARDHKLALTVLGQGPNVVLGERIAGLTLRMSVQGVRFDGAQVTVAAGEDWNALVWRCIDEGCFGLENLALIPGSAGAAPIQNIGAYGVELSEYLTQVTAVHRETLETREFDNADCDFSYRDSVFRRDAAQPWIITGMTLRLKSKDEPRTDYPGLAEALADNPVTAQNVATAVTALRQQKLPDPADTPNAGSFFKNPIVTSEVAASMREQHPDMPQFEDGSGVKLSAAWLIERAGLKGTTLGKVSVSPRHSLVLVNDGGATATDVQRLAAHVRACVEQAFGITLEQEPLSHPSR